MVYRFLRSLSFGLLLAMLMAPATEWFDHWDNSPGLAGDAEFHVAAIGLTAGLFLVAALLVTRWQPGLTRNLHRLPAASASASWGGTPLLFFPGSSPPGRQLQLRL